MQSRSLFVDCMELEGETVLLSSLEEDESEYMEDRKNQMKWRKRRKKRGEGKMGFSLSKIRFRQDSGG